MKALLLVVLTAWWGSAATSHNDTCGPCGAGQLCLALLKGGFICLCDNGVNAVSAPATCEVDECRAGPCAAGEVCRDLNTRGDHLGDYQCHKFPKESFPWWVLMLILLGAAALCCVGIATTIKRRDERVAIESLQKFIADGKDKDKVTRCSAYVPPATII
eukprot:Sspe_Gene.38896::Locus_18754_Transcript_1_1_Confidence_1.000_Length_6623::g.38896::m.38896